MINVHCTKHKAHLKSQKDRIRAIIGENKVECIEVCKGSESHAPKLSTILLHGLIKVKGFSKVGVQVTFLSAASPRAKFSRAKFQRGLGKKEFTIISFNLALHSDKRSWVIRWLGNLTTKTLCRLVSQQEVTLGGVMTCNTRVRH